jgi:hypothetical protein
MSLLREFCSRYAGVEVVLFEFGGLRFEFGGLRFKIHRESSGSIILLGHNGIEHVSRPEWIVFDPPIDGVTGYESWVEHVSRPEWIVFDPPIDGVTGYESWEARRRGAFMPTCDPATATGEALDARAWAVGITRDAGETCEQFRQRLNEKMRSRSWEVAGARTQMDRMFSYVNMERDRYGYPVRGIAVEVHEDVRKSAKLALDLLRDLPTRSLDATMRARVLEVERAIVGALQTETDGDTLRMAERGQSEKGSAVERMVRGYDE